LAAFHGCVPGVAFVAEEVEGLVGIRVLDIAGSVVARTVAMGDETREARTKTPGAGVLLDSLMKPLTVAEVAVVGAGVWPESRAENRKIGTACRGSLRKMTNKSSLNFHYSSYRTLSLRGFGAIKFRLGVG
jgi:hypothetical protein